MAHELVLSDLVALVILEKAISKFTKDDIGKEISIPYTDGGGSEITIDKVFLPSYTEMCGYNNNGTHLSVRYLNQDSRIKTGQGTSYWLRGPAHSYCQYVWYIWKDGDFDFQDANTGNYGIATIIVIH